MIIRWHENFITGDVAFLLIATVIELIFVWPALALIYGGLAARKDLLQLSRCLLPVLAGLSVTWCLWAFSLAFAPGPGTVPQSDPNSPASIFSNFQEMLEFSESQKDESMSHGRGGVVGGNDYLNFNTHSPVAGSHRPVFASRRPFHQVPHILFMTLHMMLFIVAPTPLLLLMIGRIRPVGILLFAILWGTVIYSPLTHWVWGDGWLESLGVVDSAGGLLHVGVGFSALACAVVFRLRKVPNPSAQAVDSDDLLKNSAMVDLALLAYWIGTAFVNSSLTMHADGRAVVAFMNSHLAACAGMIAGPLAISLIKGRLDKSAGCIGAFSGLIAIAPGCAMILPQTAIITGAAAATLCSVTVELFQVRIKERTNILVFVLQGVGGSVGCFLVGIFATTNVAGLRWDGRMIEGAVEGNLNQFGLQVLGIGAAGLWGFIGTLVLLIAISSAFRCRNLEQLPA